MGAHRYTTNTILLFTIVAKEPSCSCSCNMDVLSDSSAYLLLSQV